MIIPCGKMEYNDWRIERAGVKFGFLLFQKFFHSKPLFLFIFYHTLCSLIRRLNKNHFSLVFGKGEEYMKNP